jgi:hypothetical protein
VVALAARAIGVEEMAPSYTSASVTFAQSVQLSIAANPTNLLELLRKKPIELSDVSSALELVNFGVLSVVTVTDPPFTVPYQEQLLVSVGLIGKRGSET